MAKVKSTANKVNKRIEPQKLKTLGVLAFDFDNLYPNRCIDIVNDSGTAVTALRMFQKYVSGNGTTNKDFGLQKVNQDGLTVNKLIRKMSRSLGLHQGIALHVNYNGLGQKTAINFVSFEYPRLTLEDGKQAGKIAVYDDWGLVKRTKIIKNQIDYINKYNPSKVFSEVDSIKAETDVEKWNNYQGQLFYWTPEGSSQYPLAPYDAVLEDMMTEAQTKRFKNSTASRNFLASHMLITGVELDEDGEPLKAGEGIASTMEEFQGGDNASSIIHLERESEDEVIELKKIDIQNYDGLYEYTENSSRDSILRTYLIPPTLLIQQAGKLGTSREISDAKAYFNDITAPDRKIIEELLEEVLTNFVYDINPSGDFSIEALEFTKEIPKEFSENFTEDEIRASLGYAPKEKQEINPNIQ